MRAISLLTEYLNMHTINSLLIIRISCIFDLSNKLSDVYYYSNQIRCMIVVYRKDVYLSYSIIIMYILLALIVSTAVIYFIVASQEYSDLLEFLQVGIQGETQEKQVEMTLFIGAGIVYLGLFVWILKTKLKSKIPYVVVAAISAILIATYAASRTIGVPLVGVEYYIGKLDMVSKVLQVVMIGISVHLIFTVRKTTIKEETIR